MGPLLSAGLILALALLPIARARSVPSPTLDYPAYLIAVQRYRDAGDYLETAPQPYTLQTLCSRATLLLYTGRPNEAFSEFEQIRTMTPGSEPLADYGEGLCALEHKDLATAGKSLDRCVASPGYPLYRDRIDLARAVIDSAQGNLTDADQLCAGIKLPLAAELVAMDEFRSDPTSGDSAALMIHEPWSLPGDVPRVTEISGLHAIGVIDHGSSELIEPSLAGSPDADAIDTMLLNAGAPTAAPISAKRVSGTIVLAPNNAGFSPRTGTVVSYSVDESLSAIVNSGSYDFHWDTTTVSNGIHTITIEIDNGAGGQKQVETKQYDVENAAGGVPAGPLSTAAVTLDDAGSAAIADAWLLLTLQPSYKAAEMILSRAAAAEGDRDAALNHFAVAAAIDPNFAGSLGAITAAYSGREPLLYPLAPGGHGIEPYAGAHPDHPNSSLGIWRGNSAIKEVALTFDDGPSPTNTPPLLDALDAAGAPATFFVVGIRAEAVPDIIHRMHDMGDEVEDHSFTHPNLDQAIPLHITEEILRNAVIVRALAGIWPHFLRPPGGETNPHVLQEATACGMAGAFWTIDVLPAEDSGSSANVVKFVMSRVIPGAVILMHDGTLDTTQAIPELTAALRARGYKLVTLLQIALDTAAPSAPSSDSAGTKLARSLFHR